MTKPRKPRRKPAKPAPVPAAVAYRPIVPGDIWQPGDGFFCRHTLQFYEAGSHLHGKPYDHKPDFGPYFRPLPQ